MSNPRYTEEFKIQAVNQATVNHMALPNSLIAPFSRSSSGFLCVALRNLG
jgi:hypothetical protein